jgi:hypothetical protein
MTQPASPPAAAPSAPVHARGGLAIIFTALMPAILVAALDQTIAGGLVPSAAR